MPLSGRMIVLGDEHWLAGEQSVHSKIFKPFQSAVECFYADRQCDLTLHLSIFALPCQCVHDPETGWFKLRVADNSPSLPLQLCEYTRVSLTHGGGDGFVWPRLAYAPSTKQDPVVVFVHGQTAGYLWFQNGMCNSRQAYLALDGTYRLEYKTQDELMHFQAHLEMMQDALALRRQAPR